MDGADRDAGAEVPPIEINVLVVVVDAGRAVAATTIRRRLARVIQ